MESKRLRLPRDLWRNTEFYSATLNIMAIKETCWVGNIHQLKCKSLIRYHKNMLQTILLFSSMFCKTEQLEIPY